MYARKVYRSAADAITLVETLVLPAFEYSYDPAGDASKTAKRRWQKKVVETIVKKENNFEDNLK